MQTEWSRGSNDDGRTDGGRDNGGRDDAGPSSGQGGDDVSPVATGPVGAATVGTATVGTATVGTAPGIQDDVMVDEALVGAVSDDLVVEDVTEELADELEYDEADLDAAREVEFEADLHVDEQDSADEDGEQEAHRSAVDAVDGLLDEVELALTRLDDGTYGRCEECGDPIDDDRLADSPIIRSCGRCSASEGTEPLEAAGSSSVTSTSTWS